MLMGTGQQAPANTLALFYVINLVIALGVLVLGGTFLAKRWHGLRNLPESPARTILAVGLAGLWILDGLLQAQPLMATAFISELVAPAAQEQPRILYELMHFGMHIWNQHPISWDIVAIWVQIGIGLAILLGSERRGRRVGLLLSIVWSLVVWVFGEGLGSLFSGGSMLLGSPGSAPLYTLAAVALLIPSGAWPARVKCRLVRASMILLWLLSAFLQAWPPNQWWSARQLFGYFHSQASMPEPAAISAPIYAVAHLAQAHPVFTNGVLTALFLAIAALWAFNRTLHAAWLSTTIVSFLVWWLGQDFGVFGGMGTDPNTAALILLALAVMRWSPLTRTAKPSPRPTYQSSAS
ncbi:hypothetical protein [Sulfobacillus harzensis]|uniref:Uncharacterized protein n=1 Tax=Sulfobacillus harzensis TaxID=2729629 RepID=A0A7Y0L118_9FIRM|nr:hypothetical protein [Sulfobacillus harzensis]NMP21312.1 hypothetical protein [Sulfobacillus harzensis]